MYALQIRVLIAFMLIVALAIALASVAIPTSAAADSATGTVSVEVRVARRVALSMPPVGATMDAAALTVSNVECETSTEWVERRGERVLLLTVVPVL